MEEILHQLIYSLFHYLRGFMVVQDMLFIPLFAGFYGGAGFLPPTVAPEN